MPSKPSVLVTTFLAVFASSVASAGELIGAGVISTGLQETSAALSPDNNTLYFMRSDFAEKDDTILVGSIARHGITLDLGGEPAPVAGQLEGD